MKNKRYIAVLSLFLSAACAVPDAAAGRIRPDTGMNEASAQVTSLDTAAKTLCSDQKKLISRVETAQNALQTTAYALGTIAVLDASLKGLEASVDTLYGAAKVAETIPQTREKARPIRESLETARASVKKARITMTGITQKTEPIRKKLQSAADKLDKIEVGLVTVNKLPCNTTTLLTMVNRCVQRAGSNQACASAKFDRACGATETIYRDYDAAIQPLIASPSVWIPSTDFVNPFAADMQALEKLRQEIAALKSRLDALADQLAVLNAVLDQKFGFSFPYPTPTVTDFLHTSDYDVEISGRIIMQGVGAIEDAIERYLSDFLWGILKGLGVDGYVRQLQNAYNSAVNSALRAVNFDIDVDLPSFDILDTFNAEELVIQNVLDGLSIPDMDLNAPGFSLPNMPSVSLPGLQDNLKLITPYAFQLEAPNLCEAATSGCQ